MNYPDFADAVSFFDATREQIQCWHYNNKAGKQHHPEILKLDSTLENPDLEALEKAIEWTVRRHESLRTCFRVDDGQIKQCVLPYNKEIFSPSRFDVSDETDEDRIAKRVTAIVEAEKLLFMDLSHPPLFRSSLFKVSGTTYYVCLQIHHIISDVWSQAIIYREITNFYQAFSTGHSPRVEPLKMQLKDYAVWQKQWRQENKAMATTYWRNKLAGVALTAIGRSGENKEAFIYALNNTPPCTFTYHISHSRYARLTEFSSLYRSGILSVMIVSLQLLFIRLKGKEKILISMPVASRFFPGMESIIGYLMGGIHLFQVIRPDMTINDMVQESYLEFLEATRYVIFDHDELDLDKDLRLYCDVFVNFLSREMLGNKKLPAVEGREHQQFGGYAYYALSFHLAEHEDGLVCSWMYNTAIYSDVAINHLMRLHEQVLDDMYKSPQSTASHFIS
jgi:hypothetical protein